MSVQAVGLILCGIGIVITLPACMLLDFGYKKTFWVLMTFVFALMFVAQVIGFLFHHEIWKESGKLAGRTPQNKCRACGYDLRGITSDVCPECGNPLIVKPKVQTPQRIGPVDVLIPSISFPLFCAGIVLVRSPNDNVSLLGIGAVLGFGGATVASVIYLVGKRRSRVARTGRGDSE